jgi:nucleoside-diphosphate-sugar epimerase
MRVLLLGATGRTGKIALELLLSQGHDVHALVRDKEKVTTASDKLHLFVGNPQQKADLQNAAHGCNSVLAVLNISRNSDFPWAKLRTSPTVRSDTMKLLLEISNEEKIQKIVVCTAWGVNETKKDLPGWFRWFIENSNIGIAYADHERQEKILASSSIHYVIVRPVGLTDSKKAKPVQTSQNNSPRPRLTISRINTAKFMIEQLTDSRFDRQAVTIFE